MHKKYNKFLVISFVGVFILGVYSYFYNDFIGEVSSADSSLTSSLGTDVLPEASDSNNKTFEDTSFIMDLNTLTRIKIDTTLIKGQPFKLLVNNDIPLGEAPYGRINPFSPIGKDKLLPNKTGFILKSNPASSVTTKSAILNGLLEGTTSDNVYFEYGTTESLGGVTPKATLSPVGSFAAMLSGLNSKTSYYYKAVANINGKVVYGELTSFKTN